MGLFDFGSPAAAAPQQDSAQTSTLAGQWNDWISQPENRSALMQFGISLLQPIGVGQTKAGHVAQALGAGAEAAQAASQEEAATEDKALQNQLAQRKVKADETRSLADLIRARKGDITPYQQYQVDAGKRKETAADSQAFMKFLTNAAGADINPNNPAKKALAGDQEAMAQMRQVYDRAKGTLNTGSEGTAAPSLSSAVQSGAPSGSEGGGGPALNSPTIMPQQPEVKFDPVTKRHYIIQDGVGRWVD